MAGGTDLGGLEKRIRKVLKSYGEILAAYLFGSVLHRLRPDSDVDVAVFVRPGSEKDFNLKFWEVWGKLDHAAKRNVDLVVLNEAGPILRMQVFKKGKLILEEDRLAHRRFRAEAMIEYGDVFPVWQRHILSAMKHRVTKSG